MQGMGSSFWTHLLPTLECSIIKLTIDKALELMSFATFSSQLFDQIWFPV